jgi:hypothetical protein
MRRRDGFDTYEAERVPDYGVSLHSRKRLPLDEVERIAIRQGEDYEARIDAIAAHIKETANGSGSSVGSVPREG